MGAGKDPREVQRDGLGGGWEQNSGTWRRTQERKAANVEAKDFVSGT